jgi:hypothetical protein
MISLNIFDNREDHSTLIIKNKVMIFLNFPMTIKKYHEKKALKKQNAHPFCKRKIPLNSMPSNFRNYLPMF